jgi:carboxymethylenebutenolidase
MRDVTIQTPQGDMPAAVAEPAGAPAGGIVVIQEAFGVNAHIRDIARRLADAGYLTIAPALFHRNGSPTFDYDGDMKDLMPVFQSLTGSTVDNDVAGAVGWLTDQGIAMERMGIVGFCMGGTVALHSATVHPFGASVSFYGGGVAEGRFGMAPLVDQAPNLLAPWLGLYGDQDHGIPVDQVEALRAAAATAVVETEVVRYPDADHGFNCDVRASYHAGSAADAWARTLAWFERHLG